MRRIRDTFWRCTGGGPKRMRRSVSSISGRRRSYTRCWFVGFYDGSGGLVGVTIVVSDLAAPRVWHIAFFLVATVLHGTGAAAEIYAALEEWAIRHGAQWIRLGVVEGYRRAERFWEKWGFQEVRVRNDHVGGDTTAIVRVLVKPLGVAGMEEYLKAVPRDQRDSPLP
jgi:GNAT superfamily N-acetyltransferase